MINFQIKSQFGWREICDNVEEVLQRKLCSEPLEQWPGAIEAETVTETIDRR